MIAISEGEPVLHGAIGASIVLYQTHVTAVLPLVQQLLGQGCALVYLIDNSTSSFEAFAQWTPPDRVVTITTGKNLGYGGGHNLAIRDSVRRHRYHVICNPDIELRADTLRVLHTIMEARNEVGLCMPRIVGRDGATHYLCKRLPSPIDLAIRRFTPANCFASRREYYEMRDYSYDSEMEPFFLSGCFMFFRSSVLAQLGGFDERFFLYMEDLDLSRRAQQIARNLYFPKTEVVHGYQRGAYKSLKLFGHFVISILRYFNKWGWFEQRWFR